MKPTRSEALSAPVQSFTFHDTTLDVARDNGDLWVSIRRVCEALGIDPSAQRKKLRSRPWAVEAFITSTGPDGKTYQNAMLHLDALPMWLATIEPSRVSPEARPRLERFQLECAKALRDHFFGAPAAAGVGVDEDLFARRSSAEHQARLERAVADAQVATREAARAALDAFLCETESPRFVHRGLEAKLLVELARYCSETEGGLDAALHLQAPVSLLAQLTTIQRDRRSRREGWFVEQVPTGRDGGLVPLFDAAEDHEAHQVVAALADLAGEREWSAAELLAELARRDDLPHFAGSAKSLGRLLARYRDRRVNGRVVRARRSRHSGMLVWRFEPLVPAS